ncbi:hypothetical protein [Oceanobacillus kimchii]|uniref:Uncharacterized protein n=1 Tax=Oceanobacillus kimchii TaxID=746691 RepID=A0ABQ5TIN6_9BACI|nr:hypothetical protein [Oceanobacillus kimchii]GLO66136.1 hypothetical protein MACH08_19200 [Oceanobacillus kimchii]
MEKNNLIHIKSISHYQNQIYKILGLFESNDPNADKFGEKVLREVKVLPDNFPSLSEDVRFVIVVNHLNIIVGELQKANPDNHYIVKNNVFESLNLLDDIMESL